MTDTKRQPKPTADLLESDIWFRNCLQENPTPLNGKVTGKIPKWIEGNLLRNGPGLFDIGGDQFKHLFDGMALLHRFHISNGTITYSNKFLRSERYKIHTEANRIALTEFGTVAYPDPCKTMWQRFMSRFESNSMDIDNCNVTVYPSGEAVYVATERKNVWRIDPVTLESIEKVDLSKCVAVSHAIAHTHEEKDGTVYTIGNSFIKGAHYNIMKFPPRKEENGEHISTLKQASIVATIPARWPYHPGYYHSFCLTENYVVFIEQPLCVSIPRMATSRIRNVPPLDALVWYDNYQTRFYVVSKATGAVHDVHWESVDPFFFFHTINAYEDNDHVVLDICASRDASVFFDIYRERIEKFSLSDKSRWFLGGTPQRFVLPLNPSKDAAPGTNLVTLSYTKASAKQEKANQIICVPEEISDVVFEFPRINYDLNGQKYKYFYGMSKDGICKVNWETHKATWWLEKDVYPTEPIFVGNPNGTTEDDGVVLSALLKRSAPNEVDLLVLDARTLTELGRVRFNTPSAVPSTFHGVFLPPGSPKQTVQTNGY